MRRIVHLSPVALAFGYVAFGIAALILFAAPLWYAWQVTVEDGRAELLKVDAQRLTEVFRRGGPEGLAAFVNERVALQIAGERILLVTDASQRPLAGNLPAWPAGVPREAGTFTATVDIDGVPTHSVLVHTLLPGGYNLLVGRDTARFEPLQRHFWYGLAVAVSILTIVGILGGIVIQQTLLSRVESIRHTVSAIMKGDLSHRLPTRLRGDELDTFSQTLNGMLDQIEQLVNGIRNVSNSIAHDLRTPLAELRSRLEELSLNRPDPNETFSEIEIAVADVDRVIGMFNALLRLAEIDTGMRRSGFVQVDAAQIAKEVVEFYLPAAELKDVTLTARSHGPVQISGDPLLLAQAISNLIDNAVKYVTERGTVSVEVLRRDAETVEIVVSDDGPGIGDAEKSKLAQRFYRGDASRGTPGVGLGLSLVEAVARLHGGALEFSDNHPGLSVKMTIEQGIVRPLLSHRDATPELQENAGPLQPQDRQPAVHG